MHASENSAIDDENVVKDPVRVLIVDGFSNHDWKLTTSLIEGILMPTGLFTVDVSTASAHERC